MTGWVVDRHIVQLKGLFRLYEKVWSMAAWIWWKREGNELSNGRSVAVNRNQTVITNTLTARCRLNITSTGGLQHLLILSTNGKFWLICTGIASAKHIITFLHFPVYIAHQLTNTNSHPTQHSTTMATPPASSQTSKCEWTELPTPQFADPGEENILGGEQLPENLPGAPKHPRLFRHYKLPINASDPLEFSDEYLAVLTERAEQEQAAVQVFPLVKMLQVPEDFLTFIVTAQWRAQKQLCDAQCKAQLLEVKSFPHA
ncbi:hypothetical protein EDB19DRAFT_1835611 [Suillus lakei]|nr:hypothetical protein EDB19DRAFT_1835611 [Suillus lakei]